MESWGLNDSSRRHSGLAGELLRQGRYKAAWKGKKIGCVWIVCLPQVASGDDKIFNSFKGQFCSASLLASSVASLIFHSVRHQFRAGGRPSPKGASESSETKVTLEPASSLVPKNSEIA
jgi:hypothetical protein